MAALMDRASERDGLDRLVEAVRASESQVLVVRGDPGVGKTVLLEYLAVRASDSGCRVSRAAGVQSEMELAFAGLHQLCAPMLSGADPLPAAQHEALRIAFGMAAGPPPDQSLVSLAVLGLLSAAAEERPLVCVIDDAQWLDQASMQALGFVARRLAADPVGLVLAAREPGANLAGLPELGVAGLPDDDARALLDSVLAGPLDTRIRDLIVAETRGNPLALLELPRGLTPAQLAGGFGLPGAAPLTDRIEDSFRQQLEALPAPTRHLVQLAAADPSGDQALVWRAAERLGIPVQAEAPAVEDGLAEFSGGQVKFRHPLARSAAYRSASLTDRQQMHAVLAEMTDPIADPDRRAWHRAQAASDTDEEVAAELERSAGRAQARGGLAAAAAFLERSVLLTADPARRAQRTLAAAQASMQGGAFAKALELLVTAEGGPLDGFQRALAGLVRGHVAFVSGLGDDAPSRLLLQAARQFEPFSLDMARETYLTAWAAAVNAGGPGEKDVLLEICRGALNLPSPPGEPGPLAVLLDGLARLITDGLALAAPALKRATQVLIGIPVEDVLRWGWMTPTASIVLWDYESDLAISTRQAELYRAAGALAQMPVHLATLAVSHARIGDFAAADSLIAEAESVSVATGSHLPPFAALRLRGLQGREAEASSLLTSALELARASGQELAAIMGNWGAAVLYNGLARYQEAVSAARQATSNPFELVVSPFVLPELVEAATRVGDAELARDALARLATMMPPDDNDFAHGVEARCQALLSQGAEADRLYREAVDRLSRTRVRPELARAHLVYGEWLRREGRRINAREQLRTAHDILADIGMEAFAERARQELAATGEKLRKRTTMNVTALTAQEASIARLARDGLTNSEIGARLFLSPRTVAWHLHSIFAKLEIGSRRELEAALAHLGRDG